MQEQNINKTPLVVVAQTRLRHLLDVPLNTAGLEPHYLDWFDNLPPRSAFPNNAHSLLICALRLKFPARRLADALLSFPRRIAEIARSSGVEQIIFAVPEVRGVSDVTGAALRSSVIMMEHSFKAVVLRCGLLIGTGGIVEGLHLAPFTVIAGQGWSEAHPLLPSDFSAAVAAVVNNAQNRTAEPSGEKSPPSFGIASTEKSLPLADLTELLKGGGARLHVPDSLISAAHLLTGSSLEERALFGGGSLKVETNDLERLTGKKPVPLSQLAHGKVPKWLPLIESSR